MKWGDLKEIIGAAAPIVGTALGGPAGAAVGSLVAKGLGVEETPEAVGKAIQSDPKAILEIKRIESDNKEMLHEYAFKTLDAELKDKQNAREMNKHSIMPAVICCALTAMVTLCGVGLFFIGIPDQNSDISYLMFGALIAKWGDSIAFWVGTTRSSAEKDRKFRV